MNLYIILIIVCVLAVTCALASYVSMRRTYAIEDLDPLENGRR